MASEWFLYTIYLSLVGLFPTVGHTKKAVIPTLGLFIEPNYAAVSFNIYVENKENLTYIASNNNNNNNKTGIPAQPALLFHAATNTSQTHKKNKMKS